VIVVEVLAGGRGGGGGGRVAERVRLAALPAVIGRGYDADVILDDPYVDAAHARLAWDENGGIVVEDLGSANGVYGRDHGARVARLDLAPGATFRVGRTTLRIATPGTAVAPALRDEAAPSAWRIADRRGAALALTLLGAPLFGLEFWLSSTEPSGGADFALGAIGVLAVVLAWAGLWALGTRVKSGHGRFPAHLAVSWIVFAVAIALFRVEDWYRFFADDAWTVDVVSWTTFFAAVVVVLDGHLAVASRLRRVTRVAAGFGIALVFTVVALIGDAADRPSVRDIHVAMPLKPVPASLVPTETPNAFFERAAALQAAVDEDAREDAPSEAPDGAPAQPAPDSAVTRAPSAARTSPAP
jgi:hypothetical protein